MHNILRVDQPFVCCRGDLDGVLNQSVKEFSSGCRLASVEPEDKFVEVVVKMLRAHRPLMGSEYPAFEQRDGSVDPREQMLSRLSPELNSTTMNEPLQFTVGVEPVGAYRASRFDRGSDEAMESGPVEIGDPSHANATDALAVLFSRDGDQCLLVGQTADSSFGLRSAPVGFIDFHDASQTITAWAHHRLPQFVKDQPRGPVTAKTQDPLKSQGAHPVLLAGYIPHCSKPNSQGKMGVLKHGSRKHRNLPSASVAKPEAARNRPSPLPLATGTPKSLWPPEAKYVFPTGRIIREAPLQFHQCARIIFGHSKTLHLGGG